MNTIRNHACNRPPHDPTKRHMLERHMANAVAPGAIGDAQRRAMWAKRKNPVAADGGPIRLPGAPSGSGALYADDVAAVARGGTAATGGRGWGESRPGEMYPQVEGPGNPSWEKRHPEYAPKIGSTPVTRPPRASSPVSSPATMPVKPGLPPNPGRPYIPVPRVPVPGHEQKPQPGGASRVIYTAQMLPFGIWAGKTPDPARKKMMQGRITNRAGAAIRFLEQHTSR